MSIDYTSFPIICTGEFEAVTFDCTVNEAGYYYLMLTFFKNYADDETGDRAQGFTLATDIKARTLEEIDAQCGVLFDVGLFNHLHIDAHGTLFGPNGDELGPICWNHIAENKHTLEDIVSHSDEATVPATTTIQ
jgi:hypothetical protein